MSAKERDDDQGSADTEPDTTKPDTTKPDGTVPGDANVPDVTDTTASADVEESQPVEPAPEEAAPPKRKLTPTRASGLWAGLIIAAIVLIFLLVFILQNLDEVEIQFLMFSGSLPIGVAVLLSAIAGILMVAVPGVARMIQLRRHAKR